MSPSEIYRAVMPVIPQGETAGARPVEPGKTSQNEFAKVLDQQLQLSRHAEARIKSRALPWDAAMEKRIGRGMDVAAEKGSRSALILADNVAVIANVTDRTVVTAMDRSQLKEKVFTNIDSAVLV